MPAQRIPTRLTVDDGRGTSELRDIISAGIRPERRGAPLAPSHLLHLSRPVRARAPQSTTAAISTLRP